MDFDFDYDHYGVDYDYYYDGQNEVQYFNPVIKTENDIVMFDPDINVDYYPSPLMAHAWWNSDDVGYVVNSLYHTPSKVAWVGDFTDSEETKEITDTDDIYELAFWEDEKPEIKAIEESKLLLSGKFLVNHTKKVYLDCDAYQKRSIDKNGRCIHPLPILTAIGSNELFHGDYQGINADVVGNWCWDTISVEDSIPVGYKPVEYTFQN